MKITGLSITAQSLPSTSATAVSNLTTAKSGVPPTIPVLLQQPLSHTNISSQNNHETQQLVTNVVATIPVSGNGEELPHAISVQTPEAAQQQLIAAAMASLSTAIPSGSISTPQTMNHPTKAISTANGNSVYQGKIYCHNFYSINDTISRNYHKILLTTCLSYLTCSFSFQLFLFLAADAK